MGDNGVADESAGGGVQKRKCDSDFSVETCPSMFYTKRSKVNFAYDYDVDNVPNDYCDDDEEEEEGGAGYYHNGDENFNPVLEPCELPTHPPNAIADVHAFLFSDRIPYEVDQLCLLPHCGICEKEFTSPSMALQHYFGNNHRKVVIRATVAFGYNTPTLRSEPIPMEFLKGESSQEIFFCDVCKIDLQHESSFEMHMKGKAHAKKLRLQEQQQTGGAVTTPAAETTGNSLQELSAELEPSKESSALKHRYCLPCQASFSSIDGYNEHLSSESHRAKCSKDAKPVPKSGPPAIPVADANGKSAGGVNPVQFLSENPSFIEEMLGRMKNTTSPNECGICGITVTGEANFRMHIEGKVHRRKLQLMAASQIPGATPSQFRCELCDVVCTDQENLSLHFGGKKHIKKALQLQHV